MESLQSQPSWSPGQPQSPVFERVSLERATPVLPSLRRGLAQYLRCAVLGRFTVHEGTPVHPTWAVTPDIWLADGASLRVVVISVDVERSMDEVRGRLRQAAQWASSHPQRRVGWLTLLPKHSPLTTPEGLDLLEADVRVAHGNLRPSPVSVPNADGGGEAMARFLFFHPAFRRRLGRAFVHAGLPARIG